MKLIKTSNLVALGLVKLGINQVSSQAFDAVPKVLAPEVENATQRPGGEQVWTEDSDDNTVSGGSDHHLTAEEMVRKAMRVSKISNAVKKAGKILNNQIAKRDETYERLNTAYQTALVEKILKEGAPDKVMNSAVQVIETGGASQTDPDTTRNLNCESDDCQVPLSFAGIWGYGCWCNFGPDLLKGQGKAVNPHDRACERLQRCLRCAEIDGANDGYQCDPTTQDYNTAYGFFPSANALQSNCRKINKGNACATHICTCELQLVNELLELIWQQYVYDPAPRHVDSPMGGHFEMVENCPTRPGNNNVECCGRYPFRYTYNTFDRDCCEKDQQLFSPFDSTCCAHGVQKLSDGGCSKKRRRRRRK